LWKWNAHNLLKITQINPKIIHIHSHPGIKMVRSLTFCIAIAMALSFEATAQSQRLTPELLWQLGRVGLDCTSPDGQWAVYGVQRYDMAKNKGFRVLYLVNVQSGDTKALTAADQSATDAEFHPGGQKIGFLRDGKMFEVNRDGTGEAQVYEPEISGFHYAPNGQFVLYAQEVRHDPTISERMPDLPKTSGRITDGLFYRHWKTWRDGKYSNLFYCAYKDGKMSGEPKKVMYEAYDTPLAPLGGMEQIAWSPDCRFIVYTCRKQSGTDEARSTNSNLYIYEVSSGKTLNATPGNPGYDQDPVFSPDGHYLAWTSLAQAGNEADRPRLMLLDTRTQQQREVTEGWDYEANNPVWSADSKTLYFLSSVDFTYQIYKVGAEDRLIRRVTKGGDCDYTALKVAGNELVATRTSMIQPPEVFAINPQTGAERALSTVNAALWGALPKAKVERRAVKTFDGKEMNVWMIFPPDFDKTKKYPSLLYCQGGPQSALSQGFSFRWNFSLMAANGYVVVAPCRRGMPGSGTAWNDAITGHYGDSMKDLLAAADAAKKEPFIDGNRMGAVGASYGGYSVYWLAGNHQKRFKTFIAHCGMFNLESFYGTTEEVWFPQHDFEGPYWQTPQPRMYATDNPKSYVQNWDTPILVIHNELDFRVPFSEGIQAFQAAQLKGIPSRFLSFPDEGHWMSKPQNSLLWQRTFFDWLDRFLK